MVRGRRTRPKNNKFHSILDRIRSGVPTTSVKIPRDPPQISHTLTVPVRIRCNLIARSHPTETVQTIQLPVEPTAAFNLVMKFNPARSGNPILTWAITRKDLFRAACMRVYGVDPTIGALTQNFYNTDFGILKTVLYGPDSRMNVPINGISLTVDYGPTIPGFSGRDQGGANTRAVVYSSAPRVSWMNFSDPDSNLATGSANLSNLPYQTGVPSNAIDIAAGLVDFTVIVRRGAILPQPIPSANSDAEYIDTLGNVKSLTETIKFMAVTTAP